MNKPIYVCSPYRGDIKTNTEQAKGYCRKIVQEGDIPIAPHLLFLQFMDDGIAAERERAMEMNLEIMRHCEELHVFSYQISFGMLQEMQTAKPMLLKMIQDFDSQDFMLNMPAAAYDLTKGLQGAVPHKPEDYMTKITLVSPDKKNEKLWLDAVSGFFLDDQELIEYVQHLLGDVTISISSGKNKGGIKDGKYPVFGPTGIVAKTDNPVYDHEQIHR